MKECPHCHEDSFGFRELLALDYFSPDECKACGKLVRNDGFRQLLIVPGILVAFFLGYVILVSLPSSLEPFGLPLFIVLAVLPLIFLAKPVKFDLKADLGPFTPDPNNDKVILVKGWKEDELHKILDDFIEEDVSNMPPPKIDIHKRYTTLYSLTFPQDIHPTQFGFLVNYLAYPMNFGPPERSIVVAGKTTLNSDFQVPQSLTGKKAIVYLPENDQEYDVIYLQTEDGATFANSFNEGVWRRVRNPRLSSEVKTLV